MTDVSPEVHAFLLAEFEAIREMRRTSQSIIETRLQFTFALDTAVIALLGVLATTGGVAPLQFTSVALVASGPTLVLAYMTFLRALDFQIMSRLYLRAMNSIRRFYSEAAPAIAPHIKMSTDPLAPSFGRIGEGSSLFVSNAGTALLLLGLSLSATCSAMSWLLLYGLGLADGTAVTAAVPAGVASASVVVALEVRRVRRTVERAEQRYG